MNRYKILLHLVGLLFFNSAASAQGPGGSPLQVQVNNSPAFAGTPCQTYPTLAALTTGPILNNCDSEFTFNPYTDVRLFGVRAVANVMPATGGMTGSITTGTNSLTVSTASCTGQTGSVCFVNGDGIAVYGAGASETMGAPGHLTVKPSLSRVMTGTGDDVASGGTAGSTTYNYIIVAEDIGGGFSPASATVTTTTGLATLGSNSISISSITRSNNVVTVNLSAGENLAVGAMVEISGVTDPTFNGQYQVASTSSNTQFTYLQPLDTRNSASTSSSGGTVYYFVNNLVTWTQSSSGPTPFRYFICSDRASPGTYHIIGISKPNNPGFPPPTFTYTDGTLYWEDFGSTMRGGLTLPPNASDAICTGSGTPDTLVTTITGGAGSVNLTLAANASNSVSGGPIRFDNAPNIKTALSTSTAFPVYFPPASSYVTNSILDAHSISPVSIVGAFLTLNEPIILSAVAWKGNPFPYTQSGDSFQYESLPIVNCSGVHCIYFTNGSSGRFEGIAVHLSSNNAIGILSDGGGGSGGATYDRVNVTTGSNPYMTEAFEFRGASDSSGSGACHNMKEVLILGAQFSVGQTATPVYYGNRGGCVTHDSLFLSGGGALLRYDTPGGSISVGSGYRQSGYVPVWTLTGIKENGGAIGSSLEVKYFIQDTDPMCLVSYLPSFSGLIGVVRITSADLPSSGGNQICGNPFGYSVVGPTTGANTNVNAYSAVGAPIMASGTTLGSQIGMALQTPGAPAAVVSLGGSVPVGTETYYAAAVDANGNSTLIGPGVSVAVSNPNQTVTVTPPTLPAGAIGWQPYRSGALANIPGCTYISGNTPFVDTFGFTCGLSAPFSSIATSSVMTNNAVTTEQLNFVNTNFKDTLSPLPLSAARTQAFPDSNGIVPVTSYLNSAYDNFNRANGAIGSNWNVSVNGLNVSSNTVVGSTNSAGNVGMWNVGSFARNQFAEATLPAALSGTTQFAGPAIDMSGTNNWYWCTEDGVDLFLQKNIAGAVTNLITTAMTSAAGDVLRIQNQDGTLTCTATQLSGTVVSANGTDTTLTSGMPGIVIEGSAATTAAVDNWSGGNLHPLDQLDLEGDYTQPRHFSSVTVGPTAPIAGTLSPGTLYASNIVAQKVNGFAAASPVMITSAFTNATTTPANITGLSFPVLANTNYKMRCDLYYQGSASTAGLDITITGPSFPTSVFYSYDEDATSSSLQNGVASSFGTKIVGNTSVTATTNLHAVITMGLINGANTGTVQIQGSATVSGTVTVQPGSSCSL